MEDTGYEISIKEIIGMLIPKLWLIAVISIVFAAIGGIYTLFTADNEYSVNMKYYVQREVAYDQQTTSDISYAVNVIPSIKEAYASEVFHRKIANVLASEYLQYSEDRLTALIGSMITVSQSNSTSTPTYTIRITSNDRLLSASVAAVVHDFTTETVQGENYSEIQHLVAGQSFKITTYNNPSAVSVSNDVKSETVKIALIAFVVGAMLSTAFIVAYGIFDPTVRDKNKLAREVNAPVLGVIPRF